MYPYKWHGVYFAFQVEQVWIFFPFKASSQLFNWSLQMKGNLPRWKLLPVVETVYDDFILSKRKEMALLESVDAKSWDSIMFASPPLPPKKKPNLMIHVKMTKIQALPDCNCRKSNKRMVAAVEVRFDFLHYQYHTSMRKNKDWMRVCFLCLWYWLIPLYHYIEF